MISADLVGAVVAAAFEPTGPFWVLYPKETARGAWGVGAGAAAAALAATASKSALVPLELPGRFMTR
jgi:hypothetical protein